MPRIVELAAFLVLVTLGSPAIAATMLTFEGVKNDGPHITGTIDTTADTLTVLTWTENSGGDPFWTPKTSEFPLILSANFDVPECWDGKLALGNKFDGPAVNMIQWNEGTTSANFVLELGDTTLISQWSGQSVNGIDPEGLSNWLFDSVNIAPVPEPSSLMLLSLAAGAAGLFRLGRRRSQTL